MLAAAAVESFAGGPRPALAICAYSTDIFIEFVDEKDISAEVEALHSALEPSSVPCQLPKLNVIWDRYQEVGVFRPQLLGRQRTQQSDSGHTGRIARRANEFQNSAQQRGSRLVDGCGHMFKVTHFLTALNDQSRGVARSYIGFFQFSSAGPHIADANQGLRLLSQFTSAWPPAAGDRAGRAVRLHLTRSGTPRAEGIVPVFSYALLD